MWLSIISCRPSWCCWCSTPVARRLYLVRLSVRSIILISVMHNWWLLSEEPFIWTYTQMHISCWMLTSDTVEFSDEAHQPLDVYIRYHHSASIKYTSCLIIIFDFISVLHWSMPAAGLLYYTSSQCSNEAHKLLDFCIRYHHTSCWMFAFDIITVLWWSTPAAGCWHYTLSQRFNDAHWLLDELQWSIPAVEWASMKHTSSGWASLKYTNLWMSFNEAHPRLDVLLRLNC